MNRYVEIYGLGEWQDYDLCLSLLCDVLNFNISDVVEYTVLSNKLLVKLNDNKKVNEWERKSREKRIRLNDLVLHGDNYTKIKIFAAAPARFKVLLHKVRNSLKDFKYIWIGKRGVLARRKSRTQIHVLRNENDINSLNNIYYCDNEL
ncbi:fp [Adoxophyes orana granulovirus]|uniref:Fp n=1 Tax=Adoxophyes orana granulovirus TaxID=170617 RepID=Q7T9R4_GVAO|nr:fp [Adoxophyes orana granulovirus]AAP85738.1 fp [Adoxophyes orana granulovirus]AJA91741.1 FP25K [Adoxophyes orana granulovirus]